MQVRTRNHYFDFIIYIGFLFEQVGNLMLKNVELTQEKGHDGFFQVQSPKRAC